MKLSASKVVGGLLLLSVGCMLYLMVRNVSDAQQHSSQQGPIPGEKIDHKHIGIDVINNDAIHVCLCTDEATMLGAVATVNSIWKNTKHHVIFHIITNKQTYSHLKQWFDGTELKATDSEIIVFDENRIKDKILVRESRQELGSPMNFARFFYPDLIPHVHGKVIHIDDDCIVQGDITELYNTGIEPSHLIAASDDCDSLSKRFLSFPPIYSNYINFNNEKIKALGIKGTTCAFNTGVYLFDIDKWRQQNITKQLLSWMENNLKEEIYGAEKGGGASTQPMMIVLYDRVTHIPDPLWHVRHLGSSTAKHFSRTFVHNAKLLHWNGKLKPWRGVSAYKELWDKYVVLDPLGEHVPVRKTKLKS